jgi:hypothetical protein
MACWSGDDYPPLTKPYAEEPTLTQLNKLIHNHRYVCCLCHFHLSCLTLSCTAQHEYPHALCHSTTEVFKANTKNKSTQGIV